MSVTRSAPAKLNLRLRVLGREESGYHAVETLMLRLALADRITVEPGPPGIRLVVSGSDALPEGPENLCWRAADLVHRELDVAPAVVIRLEKRIPVAAGLGGGSMDAAAVLAALVELLDRDPGTESLTRVAGRLGSDVPFGLCPGGMALGWERGRRLMPLPSPPARPVLIAQPPFGIHAAEAYGWLAHDRERPAAESGSTAAENGAALFPRPDELTDWDVLERLAVNDLQEAVFHRHPELGVIRDALSEAGAGISMLCGSGACVAGIFEEENVLDRAARDLQPKLGIPLIRTVTLGPHAG
ncbi:MAG: 4-(cytidine 5'-diphospho)-2-C-methyl-D-erythritol kinase [marine benthic group bacterium]|nr:4-(cytidine 5'-diphospho)-2-C-methyl-D-erythritol kinase [Gemmatimonadota bacterium]MCL7961374.1 4-(cytidine 5'-diphospho)-2-C-methyl-D-erythritol kinase [Candidatus Carthagonibacter metallireducens]MCL7957539.1 4-(cytidine 5'-diphospho)-2-C-methyl-D-erythritol kinase [Gemmatimonadota bacterium]MCL7967887.1 4-(cytidine 5'-diphospho)-2-C-methyl-D-erythritol kinase [Gemmatimonadota bacterium]MCL7969962.1 4-(cytidine 5'-diphospho)-2-C-methyl-D-erythritol kinase [Gemmatimonadota bacterium]